VVGAVVFLKEPWFSVEKSIFYAPAKGFSMNSTIKKPSLAATFPCGAAFVAEMRRVFSVDGGHAPADLTVIYMEENGRSVGKPMDESRYTAVSITDIHPAPKVENNER